MVRGRSTVTSLVRFGLVSIQRDILIFFFILGLGFTVENIISPSILNRNSSRMDHFDKSSLLFFIIYSPIT